MKYEAGVKLATCDELHNRALSLFADAVLEAQNREVPLPFVLTALTIHSELLARYMANHYIETIKPGEVESE
jgi:hypothetical protein